MSSSSIPDGISFAELQALAEEAPTSVNADKKSMTQDEACKLVADSIEELTDKFDTIFGYKLAAMYCINMIKMHHDEAAISRMGEGDYDSALSWARDAGKCQSSWSDIQEIHCGPEDFILGDQSDED